MPVALGVLYCAPGATYESGVAAQGEAARQKGGKADLNALLRQGHTWTISAGDSSA